MMKLSVGLFAATLLIGLGSVPTLTYAEDGDAEQAKGSVTDSDKDATAEESTMKKLEEEVVKDLEKDTDQPADTLMESEGSDR